MFKSIVVGFDGSAHSSRALEIGATLAARDEIPLGIIYAIDSSTMALPDEARQMVQAEHIVDPAPPVLVDFSIAPATMLNTVVQASAENDRAMYQYAEFLLQEAEKNARGCGAQKVETSSMHGDPAEAIVEYAAERGADLIITGSRGLGKLKSFVLGSTSHKITQIAECSCLTVR